MIRNPEMMDDVLHITNDVSADDLPIGNIVPSIHNEFARNITCLGTNCDIICIKI